MEILYNPVVLEHETGTHPENPARFSCFNQINSSINADGEAYLDLVHLPVYIQRIKELSRNGGHLDLETVLSQGSYQAAVASVGLTVDAATSGDFALIRPPGHHAHVARASGFCIFNNVAIAAQNLVDQGCKVFILDFDGHYGDGTADFFYETNQVLFLSLHQSPGFPWEGDIGDLGKGAGKGYTINIPLPPGLGDDLYYKALERILPVVYEFKPDVVAVSAGFDGHQNDSLLHLRLSLNIYHKIGHLLGRHFPKIFATLEGGYDQQILYKGTHNFIAGVNQEKCQYIEPGTTSNQKIQDLFENNYSQLRRLLKPYWTTI